MSSKSHPTLPSSCTCTAKTNGRKYYTAMLHINIFVISSTLIIHTQTIGNKFGIQSDSKENCISSSPESTFLLFQQYSSISEGYFTYIKAPSTNKDPSIHSSESQVHFLISLQSESFIIAEKIQTYTVQNAIHIQSFSFGILLPWSYFSTDVDAYSFGGY